MATRVVSVRLKAVVDDYRKGMQQAAEETRKVGTQAEKLAQTRQAMQTLGTVGVAMGAALAAGVGMAVARFAEFDQAMSNVAATGEDARGNMDALRQAAIDAGAATVYSATEAANAIEEMAKAGLSAQEILGGGLTGALDLAAAGGLEVADAAGIAATALKIFKLEGSDMSHVADLLAAGAGKAMGDVSDLSQALNQAGLVANSTGLSIEETTAGLAAFASQGLLGSDAGTSFKTMLGALTPNSAKAAKEMERLGISAYDSQGQFIGLAEFAGNLKSSLSGLTDEQRNASLEIMFGSDAVRAANVLYQEGSLGIQQWTEKVDDSGYAAETAATRLDNLIGDWEKLTGALDSAFISMGEGANGPLRWLVQGLTEIVDGFNALPDWAKQLGAGMGVLAAGVALAGGATLLAIPKFNDLRESLNQLGFDGDALTGKLSRLAKIGGGALLGFAAASAGLDLLTEAIQNMGDASEVTDNKLVSASSAAEVLGAALGKGFGATGDLKIAESAVEGLAEMLDLAASGAKATGDSVRPVLNAANAVMKLGDELGDLAASDLPLAQEKFRLLAEESGLTEEQMVALINKMEPFKAALVEQATKAGESADEQSLLNMAMGDAESSAKSAADAYLEQSESVSTLNDQLLELIDSMNEANGTNQSAIDQNISYQETLAAVNQAISDGASGLDIATEAGQENMRMLLGLASDAQGAAAAQLELDGSTEGYITRMREGRDALINSAIAMGATRAQAVALADKIYAIPSEKDIKVIAQTAAAQREIDNFVNRNGNRTVNVWLNPKTQAMNDAFAKYLNADGGLYQNGVKTFASGGFEPGIYPYAKGGIHKFAEEYDEAYISMDPARRTRSEAVWVRTGQELGMFSGAGSSGPTEPVSVSLAGAAFTLMVDGNPVRAIVQEQIVAHDDAANAWSRGGVRS
ncbi:phage tail tape measure protein [Microbacterium sp. W4I20]|uniref:phage tail tape measure protein n=1 Tax=Microbacterium sp. W4I20 TaxID=3042262 RepID=UPI0027842E97|nr:phage tail tape measure protein [Microbacterium sp. W4I20]MDQ0726805.1 TP901 family phage tail tape measure protein [Microbacterium sp. W4I20]